MSQSPTSAGISADALAAAVERRLQSARPQLTAVQLAAQHEKRTQFRRLLDPGIVRPNPKDQAMASLKTLQTISDNLLREPENPKFQQFKPTNALIKRDLVDRKGALEFAIALGFRPEVQNFQPYYVFHKRHLEDLQLGNQILKEYIDTETKKQERQDIAKKNEKASKEAAAERVRLAFIDDRKTKEQRDEMEKESRAGRAEAMARAIARQEATAVRPATPEHLRMPGAGFRLTPAAGGDDVAPPAYDSEQMDEPEDDADGEDDDDATATEETRLVDTN